MNLKIILKDPKYCDGCPCLDDLADDCNLKMGEIVMDLKGDNLKLGKNIYIRPLKCIQENGE